MKSIRCAVALVSLALLTQVSPSLADSLSPLDPFEGIVDASVEVTIGDSLDVSGRSSVRLFGDDQARAEAFGGGLRNAISTRLLQSGIKTTDKSIAAVAVIIWGHSIPGEASDLHWVFYFELVAHRLDWDPACPDDPGHGAGRLGATSDAQLEDVLQRAVIGLLSDWLYRRDARSDHQGRPE